MFPPTHLLADYIDALHILDRHGALGYSGNMSVRDPLRPHIFYMAHTAASRVSGRGHISEYAIADGEPLPWSAPDA